MTHKQKILRLLSDRKPHSHHELYALGCVAHSRISDLRRDGHNIVQWREDGHYLYQLVGALEEAVGGHGTQGEPAAPHSSSGVETPAATTTAVPDWARRHDQHCAANQGGECGHFEGCPGALEEAAAKQDAAVSSSASHPGGIAADEGNLSHTSRGDALQTLFALPRGAYGE